MTGISQQISAEFSVRRQYVDNIIALLDEGNTIPFIARYRKEQHGTLDDQTLRRISERLTYLRNLEKRKQEVKSMIEAQGKLTSELAASIDNAVTLTEAEDLYRPYRPKRRTRATIAKERGLEPLADLIEAQNTKSGSAEALSLPFIDAEKGVETAQDALAGACDIVAERISDNADLRRRLRALILRGGSLVSKAATEDDSVYRLYYVFSEQLKKLHNHQILAINRGEKEDFLKVSVHVDAAEALNTISRFVLKAPCVTTNLLRSTIEDAWDRLLFPSLEREIRSSLTDQASEQAISMFSLNLKPLLMQPPVKNQVTLGLDPAYRTGCKIAVVDGTGKVLETSVIYPHQPHNKKSESESILKKMISKHGITCIAIGNGTASRESEIFVSELLSKLGGGIQYMVVSEAGASVYSASKLAADEFPDYDVSLRSAVSIARRLQDPLAELVKIDPKSIGVGQYQHDMPQARLDEALSGVVEDCVNSVGVDLNTASAPLLARVSGLSDSVARNIVAYREESGAFTGRGQLKKVPKLGPKAFIQCAGFLRISESKNILDNTSVHPESYEAANKLLELCGFTPKDMGKLSELEGRVGQIGAEKAAAHCGVGVPTLMDIVKELQKPGRDPRDELPPPLLRTDVMDIKDLKPGMELSGTVRNVIDFGVFVDVGVHQDGLVHISELCDRYVKHPSEVVSVGDVVKVTVLSVDAGKKRISLSMKPPGKN